MTTDYSAYALGGDWNGDVSVWCSRCGAPRLAQRFGLELGGADDLADAFALADAHEAETHTNPQL